MFFSTQPPCSLRLRGGSPVFSSLALVLCLFLNALPIRAGYQENRPQDPSKTRDDGSKDSSRRPRPEILVLPGEDYKIGPRDVIDIRVDDAPELSGTFNVSAKGSFLMPYLGRTVAVDKTPEELASLIAAGLKGRYLKDPHVSIGVIQYNSRSFFIQGAVRNPGVYQMEGRASLLKLLILAGGLLENHGSTAFIIHPIDSPKQTVDSKPEQAKPAEPGKTAKSDKPSEPDRPAEEPAASAVAKTEAATPGATEKSPNSAGVGSGSAQGRKKPESGQTVTDEQYELKEAKISGLLKGKFEQNVYVEPGDIINIPQTDIFFVSGDVRGPGSFPLKEGTTLRQAITLARGTIFTAVAHNTMIFREDPTTGVRSGIKVDVPAIMSGKKDDVAILANDIIVVPHSGFKATTGTMLNVLGTQALYRGIP